MIALVGVVLADYPLGGFTRLVVPGDDGLYVEDGSGFYRIHRDGRIGERVVVEHGVVGWAAGPLVWDGSSVVQQTPDGAARRSWAVGCRPSVARLDDGRLWAGCEDTTLSIDEVGAVTRVEGRLLDARAGRVLLQRADGVVVLEGGREVWRDAAAGWLGSLSPSGRKVAVSGDGGILVDLTSGARWTVPLGTLTWFDEERLFVAGATGVLQTPAEAAGDVRHRYDVRVEARSPDGRHAVTVGTREALLWHRDGVAQGLPSPDAERAALAGFMGSEDGAYGVFWSPDSERFALVRAESEDVVEIFAADGRPIHRVSRHSGAGPYLPDERVVTIDVPLPTRWMAGVGHVSFAYSPDGETMLVAGIHGAESWLAQRFAVRLLRASDLSLLATWVGNGAFHHVGFTDDGQPWALSGGHLVRLGVPPVFHGEGLTSASYHGDRILLDRTAWVDGEGRGVTAPTGIAGTKRSSLVDGVYVFD
ncbi:MAG: hypothetical protein R3F61_24845 [Myxococcota bacterium]